MVEVVDDDTDEKVQGEERPEDDEDDEVDVHVEVVFPLGLLFILWGVGEQAGGQPGRAGARRWVCRLWETGCARGLCLPVCNSEGSRHAELRAGTVSLNGFCPGHWEARAYGGIFQPSMNHQCDWQGHKGET